MTQGRETMRENDSAQRDDKTGRRWRVSAGLSLFALAALVGMIACTPPSVEVKRAALSKITTTGLAIKLDLSVFNPNSYTLPLKSVGWDLDLFRADFTQGSVALSQSIGSNATNMVPVPLGVRFAQAKAGVDKFLSGQNIPWQIGGKCTFDTPAGPIFVAYAKDGIWPNPIKGGLKLGERTERPSRDLVIKESIDVEIASRSVASE